MRQRIVLSRWIVAVTLWLALLAMPSSAAAHEVRPALIQITETGPGAYEVVWKQPMVGDMTIHMVPHLSSGAIDKPPTSETASPGFIVRTWRITGGLPLDGQTDRKSVV